MNLAALLLDIGGVVVRTPFELLDHLHERIAIPPGALTWRGPFDPARDELWRRMQAGAITERGYWTRRGREIAELAAIEGDDPWAPLRWLYSDTAARVIRPQVPGLIDLARRRGLTVGLLTNDLGDFRGDAWAGWTSFLDTVDVLVDRSGTSTLKPHPAAYAAALAALALPADRVLFIDDQPHNVEGAREVGLHALHFDVTDPAGSVRRVARRLLSGSA